MNHFPHAFRTTFARFRGEILGYWIFSILLTAGYLTRFITPEPLPSFSGPARISWDKIEFLFVLWITLRLMCAESAFRTQGGWEVRPLGRWTVRMAPFAVLAVVVLPPVLSRAVVMQIELAPGTREWKHLLTGMILPVAGWFLLGAVVTRTGGMLVSRRIGTKAGKIALGVLCVGILFARHLPMTQRYFVTVSQHDRLSGMGSGNYSYGNQVLGIQEQMPPGSRYVGDWETFSPPVFRVREVFRFPVSNNLQLRRPGLKVEVEKIQPGGDMLGLDFKVTSMDPKLLEDLWAANPVLRYQGNIHAFRPKRSDWKQKQPLLLQPGTTLNFGCVFDSPMALMGNKLGWDELLAGAEVLFFLTDKSLPKITELHHVQSLRDLEEKPPGLAGEVQEIFDHLDHDPQRTKGEAMAAKGKALPPEAMPLILARHPWSDRAWELLVRPFLRRHASDADKAALVKRMDGDPRLGEVLLEKGWKAEAMPLLRKFAEERLPLDLVSLGALADEKDATLVPALTALSARLGKGTEALEEKLRAVPGFDWQAFVREGWLRRKYAYRSPEVVRPFSFWAAREGDLSALRYLARDAARGGEVEKGQLSGLVAGAPGDVMDYLRVNIDRMKFDPGTGRWRVE